MLLSTDTAKGVLSLAAVAGPPLPLLPLVAGACSTMVEMVPLGVTSRMALLKVSAMKRSPAWSRAMPCGLFSRAVRGRSAVAAEAAEPAGGLIGRHVAGHGRDRSPVVETRRMTLLPESAM